MCRFMIMCIIVCRRDHESRPMKLRLLSEIRAYPHRKDPNWVAKPDAPIDYCYVRPNHIPSVNSMCQDIFWPGNHLFILSNRFWVKLGPNGVIGSSVYQVSTYQSASSTQTSAWWCFTRKLSSVLASWCRMWNTTRPTSPSCWCILNGGELVSPHSWSTISYRWVKYKSATLSLQA